MGPATGRPTPLVGRLRGSTPLFNPVHREPMALPLPEFHQSHFVFFPPQLSLFLFLSKFIRKRRKIFPSFCILNCISCLPSFLHENVFVVVQPPRKNGFVVRHRPQERFCGVLSPTRMIFVRGNHAPQGLLTLGQLTWFLLTLT